MQGVFRPVSLSKLSGLRERLAMSWEDRAPNGVYPIPGANALFLEPCRIINSAYSHFFVLPHFYYSRSFFLSPTEDCHSRNRKDCKRQEDRKKVKKKKKKKKLSPYPLNPRELHAQHRHQEIRKFILDAHTAFMRLPEAFSLLNGLEEGIFGYKASQFVQDSHQPKTCSEVVDFVKLGNVWQAPFYSITLCEVLQGPSSQNTEQLSSSPLFKHMVQNNSDSDVVGTIADNLTILPRKSWFLMSDLNDIQQILSSSRGDGYNLILVDPPWENKSVHRHTIYSTLPNKYLFSLPLREVASPQGALVALWVTNREKLRVFVEDELFPAWGAHIEATWFWLKIKSDGQMITKLDLLHHKPYECLIIGYISPEGTNAGLQIPPSQALPDKHVVISIPGDHSRKPPLQSILSVYVPGESDVQGLELFARDMHPRWTSWGNEPLHFQQMHYFGKK